MAIIDPYAPICTDYDESFRSPSLAINPLDLFDKARTEGRPLYTAAPMVRYSKLAFRETVAKYGVDLTWTPMILAKEFNRSIIGRDSDFTTSPYAPPTIVQFAANDPNELARATKLIAPHVNGIDLNCGCPQSWACAETLGAAMMDQPDLVSTLIKTAKATLSSPGYTNKTVSIKIRIHPNITRTIDFIRTAEAAGVDFITIHGRTRHTPSSQPVDLSAVKLVAEHCTVPTIVNGDIFSLDDAAKWAKETGCNGVMAARGLLENPGLFAGIDGAIGAIGEGVEGREDRRWEVAEDFMERVVRCPVPVKLVVHHLGEVGGNDRSQRGRTLFSKEERRELLGCVGMLEVLDWWEEVRARRGRV